MTFLLLGSVVLGRADSLTTTYSSNNSNAGMMFDVEAKKALTVDAFQFSLSPAGSSATVEIYTKTGTYVGFEANSGAWTLVAAGPPGAAADKSPVPAFYLSSPVPIAAGARQAFYIRTTADSVNYLNGDGIGTLEASDTNLSIFEGSGVSGTFGGGFAARVPNVTVIYTPKVPTDRTAPKVTVIGSRSIRTTAASAKLYILAADDVGVTSVRGTVRASGSRPVTRVGRLQANGLAVLTVKVSPGRNLVSITAKDAAGRTSAPVSVTILRDPAP